MIAHHRNIPHDVYGTMVCINTCIDNANIVFSVFSVVPIQDDLKSTTPFQILTSISQKCLVNRINFA